MTVLTASFIAAPEPTGPRWKIDFASASSAGRARSSVAASPPTMSVSWPDAAVAVEPLTGASRRPPPAAVTGASSARIVSGVIVLMSTSTPPSRRPSISPRGPA